VENRIETKQLYVTLQPFRTLDFDTPSLLNRRALRPLSQAQVLPAEKHADGTVLYGPRARCRLDHGRL
jgi:hypothetical protein